MPELLEEEAGDVGSFEELGLCKELCVACANAGWQHPTRIQSKAIPSALKGNDIIGVAQTGSGKTGTFALPVVNRLLLQKKPGFFACLVLVPTRELAMQVGQHFLMLGKIVGLKVATLVGGVDMVEQAVELSKKPHVVVGTPGRVKDHLLNTKGFHLPKLQVLIMDEADKMLDMDYDEEITAILEQLPHERQTLLFSATLNTKVERLQKASLKNPDLIEVNKRYSTVETLKQYFIFVPYAHMLSNLHYYLSNESAEHVLVFCSSAQQVHKITLTLRILGHKALPMMGRMTQENRNVALEKFRTGKIRILVCTDVAQRGLDIPNVQVVVNYGLPLAPKDYIHRVGRTARAGAAGRAVNVISQYDVPQLQAIESATGVQCDEIEVDDAAVNAVMQRVEDAEVEATQEMKEYEQEEKLNKADQGPRVANRQRKRGRDAGQMGLDDTAHGTDNFRAMRTRRANEDVFQMTKKEQKKKLKYARLRTKK